MDASQPVVQREGQTQFDLVFPLDYHYVYDRFTTLDVTAYWAPDGWTAEMLNDANISFPHVTQISKHWGLEPTVKALGAMRVAYAQAEAALRPESAEFGLQLERLRRRHLATEFFEARVIAILAYKAGLEDAASCFLIFIRKSKTGSFTASCLSAARSRHLRLDTAFYMHRRDECATRHRDCPFSTPTAVPRLATGLPGSSPGRSPHHIPSRVTDEHSLSTAGAARPTSR
jgi:hypothetical protein